jgi:3-methylcrotonyl-CoA carboxylase alpha subunit
VRFIARREGVDIPVEVERAGAGYRVKIGDRWMTADLVEAGPSLRSLRLEDGTQFSFVHHRSGTTHEISLQASTVHVDVIDPLSLKRKRREDETGGAGVVKALMPGRIVRLLVEPGAAVRKGAGLLVLEAMKMENEIQAPADGVVDQIFVKPGDTVESGVDLAHVAPAGSS